ncbi:MAG: hypothetical protein PHG95_03560 [Patescibacteria group bacterium]|nr:hypothetical protein [Patescibacteria group bacterium]
MAVAAKHKNKNDINSFLNANFNILVVLVVVIVLAAAYFLIIKPKFELTLVAIKDNIGQQEQFYQSQRQKLVDLQAAAAMYHKISDSDIRKIKEVLPDEYAKEKLFGELEDIITQQGLLITGINLEKIGEADNEAEPMAAKDERLLDIPNSEHVGVIAANIKLSSTDYAGLKNLLPLFESNLQLVDIDSIDFDQEDKTAEITLYTYYFK